MGSARQLNSPTGVMLPGSSIAPPITRTSFARRKVCGDFAAARAKVVSGPKAIRVKVSGGLVESRVRMSSTAWAVDGVNRCELGVGALPCVADVAVVVIGSSAAGGSKRCSQVSSGEV